MLRRIHSFLTWTSAIFFLLTAFLAIHSIGRFDLWSWSSEDLGESASSSASLGVGQNHFALNVWIHQDDGDAVRTTLDHISTTSQSPPLRDGRLVSSVAGLTIARGARASPSTVSYLGIKISFWPLLVLFGLLSALALISAIRKRRSLKIGSRLLRGASVASFALAVFLAVMWIRSFEFDHAAVPDRFFSENYAYLLSSRGITYWYFFDEPLRPQRAMWWRFPHSQSSSRLAATMDPAARFMGFGRSKTTYLHHSMFSGSWPPRPLTIIAIPYYALLALALVLPAGVLIHQIANVIRARRRSKGQCPNCGYDLRATPEQCPECGHTPVKTAVF